MSVFNALSTAVSGINAQSTAFTNLSNNIANSQTIGYKADTTSFQDFVAGSLTGGGSSGDISDSVSAVTVQHLDNAGTTSTSTDALAMAVSGDGMFVVSKSTGAATAGTTQFASQDYYTRNGEVYENKAGYLVNTSGYYLDGYAVDSKTGALGTTLTQLNVANVAFRPTQTTTVTSSGALTPGTAPAAAQVQVYDGQYNQDAPADNSGILNINWTAPTTNTDATGAITGYTAQVSFSPTNATGTSSAGNFSVSNTTTASGGTTYTGPYTVTFNASGAITSVTDSTGQNVTSTLSGATATIPVSVTYPDGSTQSINVGLGTIGSTSSSGTTIATSSSTSAVAPTATSDSVTSGTYEGISIESDGSVMAQFDNGDTQLVGKVALANFANVNGLNAVDGQAYTSTSLSGTAEVGVSGDNATGTLSIGKVESSTTDLTSDLSALIVAQEAYSANTKIVTTADQLLQTTIAMKQ
ncbi:flagellar hook-basal body complex protein [Gluconacetobacter takamatsuzukensis]|uniref:Flagellar hook protein FlgE n=1 Tax=Gluconacetobacter takamatsuzukensis TaxID=1286190 RepID=A0A7W4KAY8_9PROT|nr:flagellar hook-basal body complex protein [Gluconacetobacter takamatsuzukensis]MBB2203594.1 flagellar hook-basal body complex protein [Gluconacetobacter takamatsuzukensis]